MGSLKGIVHVIKLDEYIKILSVSNLRRNEIKTLVGPEGSWTYNIFFVNHYYADGSGMYEEDDVLLIHQPFWHISTASCSRKISFLGMTTNALRKRKQRRLCIHYKWWKPANFC